MSYSGLFWIHIKKSAGISTRKVLSPFYREVDRVNRPISFIQADPAEYNDILNNFRVPLGDYQFRRCLFARKFLYPDSWDNLLKFGFSREPVDRCISQFFYLHYHRDRRAALKRRIRMLMKGRLSSPKHYEFDRFLGRIEESRASSSNFYPQDLHFQTHTAPMWDDVTDENGDILLDYIFRLEDFAEATRFVFSQLGASEADLKRPVHLNKSTRSTFTPTRAQKARIESLFAKDFEIYEQHTVKGV